MLGFNHSLIFSSKNLSGVLLIVPLKIENNDDVFLVANPFLWEVEEVLQRIPNAKTVITTPQNIYHLLSGKGIYFDSKSSHFTAEIKKDSSSEQMDTILDELQTQYQTDMGEEIDEVHAESAAPIIRLVNQIIEKAYQMRASDIHIVPREKSVDIRYRIDGALRTVSELKPAQLINPIASRLKIMSHLGITEKRLPQDGRIRYKEFGSGNFDLREIERAHV